MTDVPPPPPENGGGADEQAVAEQKLLLKTGIEPELVAARTRLALALFEIRHAFLAGVRRVAYAAPFVVALMVLVWLWHVIGPPDWRWLTPEEISHLQALLFSGAISALGTVIATKAL